MASGLALRAMKTSLVALAALSLAAPFWASPALAQEAPDRLSAVADEALASDTAAWDFVEGITTEVGPRQAGTEAEQRGRDWAVKWLRANGFRNVADEPYQMQTWVPGSNATARVTAPYAQDLMIVPLGNSASTGEAGIEAEVVYFPSYADLAAAPEGSLTGKIAFISHDMRPTQDGSGYGFAGPVRWTGPGLGTGFGALGAAASIFFAYVGFDAVSTAAEETKNPQRNVPIGLIGALGICTVFYLLVSAGAIGAVGAQPIAAPGGGLLQPGSTAFASQCQSLLAAGREPLVCSKEALAFVLRQAGHPALGNMIGIAAFVALPSVILIMLFGQTRIFFVMARDGLLPTGLAKIHPKWKTPHVITMITGVAVAGFAAFLPVGQLADISNSGTLFAFFMVALSVLVLRRTQPDRHRPFRTPFVYIVAPLAIIGTVGLYVSLPLEAMLVLPVWGGIGLVIYFLYGYRKSNVALGIIEVHELDADAPPEPLPPHA